MTGTELLPKRLHFLFGGFVICVSIAWSPLLWSVVSAVCETVRPLVAFLSVHGIFVTSNSWVRSSAKLSEATGTL